MSKIISMATGMFLLWTLSAGVASAAPVVSCKDVGYEKCMARSKQWDFPKDWQKVMKELKAEARTLGNSTDGKDSKSKEKDSEPSRANEVKKIRAGLSKRYSGLKKKGTSKSGDSDGKGSKEDDRKDSNDGERSKAEQSTEKSDEREP